MNSWMILSATEGTGNKQFTIGAEDLNSTAMREGIVTVTEDSGRKANVRAVQYGKPSIDRRAPYNDIIAGGGSASISITSYGEWCIVGVPSLPDWVTIMTDEGDTYDEGDWFPPCGYSKEDCPDSTSDLWRTFSVGMGQNTTTLSRSVRLKLRYHRLDGTLTDSDFIEIRQQGIVKDINVPSIPTTKGETTKGETTWVATTDADWITITKRTGDRGEQVTFETLENIGDAREGIITITYSDGTVELMRVNQEGQAEPIGNTKLFYTTTDEQPLNISGMYDALMGYDANGNTLTYTNTYTNGQGVFEFNGRADMVIFKFYNNLTLKTIDDFNHTVKSGTSAITHILAFCDNLESVRLMHYDVSNATSMKSWFHSCYALTTLDVSTWDTSNVTDMSWMFAFCRNLTTLDVSRWNTSNVTNMVYMFGFCENLTTLDISRWNTSNVTDMTGMFSSCYALTTLDVSHFDTSKVTNMSNIFTWCRNLTTLDLNKWDTSKVTNMGAMFFNCENLRSIKISSNCIFKSGPNVYNMFYGVPTGGTLYYPSGMDATNVAKWTPSGWTAVAY